MSSATESYPSTIECRNRGCVNYGYRADFIKKKYCSRRCRIEAAGHDALEDLRTDHTRCFTCFSRLKRVYRPTERGRGIANGRAHRLGVYTYPPEALVGYQSRTPQAAVGEKVVAEDPLRIGTGTVCAVCGSTTPNARIAELFSQDAERYAERLLAHVDVDTAAFWRAFDGQEANVEYAVGKALRDDG